MSRVDVDPDDSTNNLQTSNFCLRPSLGLLSVRDISKAPLRPTFWGPADFGPLHLDQVRETCQSTTGQPALSKG